MTQTTPTNAKGMTMTNTRRYQLIANSNYESRDDEVGIAVHEAHQAVTRQHRWCDDAELIDALDSLESWIEDNCESDDADTLRRGRELEREVARIWSGMREQDREQLYADR